VVFRYNCIGEVARFVLNSFRKQLREVINLALNHNRPAECWISSNVKRLYIVIYRCASANNVNIYICLRRRVPICKLTVVNKKKETFVHLTRPQSSSCRVTRSAREHEA